MDLLDREDFFTVAKRYVRGQVESNPTIRINPLLLDVPGSELNLILGMQAIMAESNSATWARCVRALLVDTARKEELDRLAFDRYGITRKPANPATVLLTITRANNTAGSGKIPAGTRVQTSTGAIFNTDVDVAVTNTGAPTDLLVTVNATASVVGPEQNVLDNTLTQFVDQPFDTSLEVTNTAPAAGGTNEETDPQFRGRIRGFFLTVRRATAAAVQYGATFVPGVSVAKAYEVVNPGTLLPAGAGELIIADDNGNASPQMIQGVKDIELEWRPIGIPLFITGGVVVFERVTYKLAFDVGVDTVAAAQEVAAVAIAVAQFLSPGQPLLRAQLINAALSVPGVIVREDALLEPAGDIIPEDNTRIIRLRQPDISFV